MLQKKMVDVIKEVSETVCERDELICMIAIALLSKNNLFILGETGQAKSFAINQFRKRIIGARQFEKLMSKQTDEEQLFGRLDLSSIIPGNVPKDELMKNPAYCYYAELIEKELENTQITTDTSALEAASRMCKAIREAIAETVAQKPAIITTGKLPDSHIVFLDEIFKSSEGILNSLLTALNERTWTNEGEVINLPTISFFSASNEIPNFNNPEEKILKPLYDRFQLKILTKYVEERGNRLKMLSDMQNGVNSGAQNTFTLEELHQMQDEVRQVQIPARINELMDTILCELRSKNITVSDRKYFNYGPIAQAAARLDGKTAVSEEHMLILVNYLWNAPQEIETVKTIVLTLCQNPISAELDEIARDALEAYEQFDGADNKTRALSKLRDEMLRLYAKTRELIQNAGDNSTVQNTVEECVQKLEQYNKSSSLTSGYTYVSLPELARLK